MTRSRRRREQSAEMRYLGVPLIGATIAAGIMAGIAVLDHLRRYLGLDQLRPWLPDSGPLPWSEVLWIAGLLFVVTFIVLAIKAFVWPW